jgi:hypothetical protein
MTFTNEQRRAVEASGTVPMTIDGIECVVLRADVYDRVKRTLAYDDSEMEPEKAYPAVLEAWDSEGSPQDAEDYKT